MTPREYVEIVRERWRAIVAGLLLGLLIGGGLIYLVPAEYSTKVTVLVASQVATDGTSSGSGDISSQRLGTYVELLQSRRLAGAVITDLRLPTTPDELASRINVSTTPDSLLLTASVTDSSPDDVVRIANALGDEFIRNVAEIEQPSDPARQPAVVAKVFEQAQAPAVQVAPRPALYLVLGAVLGLVVGLVAAVLRHALDSRVKSRQQLEEVLGAPVLGIIGRDSKIPKSPLVMYGAPHTPLAESFRQLRTNVQFIDIDRQHKVILVTSATSGEGRSTTVCNLGLALAEAGARVLILDADLRSPSIAKYLGIDDAFGLTDVLLRRIPVERAIQPFGPTLDVLASGELPPNPSELLGSNRMVKLIATMRGNYDVILIDAAPLLPVTDAAVMAPRVDGVVVLVRHNRTVLRDLQSAKDALHAVSGRIMGSVMTMVPHSTSAQARLKPYKGGGGSRPDPMGQVPYDEPRVMVNPPTLPHPIVPPRIAAKNGGGQSAGVEMPAGESPTQPAPRPSPVPKSSTGSEANGQTLDRGESAAR